MGAAAGRTAGIVIPAQQWRNLRFQWAEAVRRDAGLSLAARMLAHVLVLDFANGDTAQCDPGLTKMAECLGQSKRSTQRALQELIDAGWIDRQGRQGQRQVPILFLMRSTVSRLSDHPRFEPKSDTGDTQKCDTGVTSSGPEKRHGRHISGGEMRHGCRISGHEMRQNRHRDATRVTHRYYIAKPWKNHNAPRRATLSENPMVAQAADRLAAAIAARGVDPLREAEATPWVLGHLVAARLLTDDALAEVGVQVSDEGAMR